MLPRSVILVALGGLPLLCLPACFETRGSAWMQEPLAPDDPPRSPQSAAQAPSPHRPRPAAPAPSAAATGDSEPADSRASSGRLVGVFRNTYYSFPDEQEYSGEQTTIFDAACKPIASVPKAFHDKLCVQGSGRLADMRTVSFARRGCDCAAVCPRSSQKICYEALDRSRFPWGRGATGGPITPFHTIAVDSSVIPLGTHVFIPAFAGVSTPDGRTHDGCFVAEDRGLKVVGQSVDVFTGSESATAQWNRQVATGVGVEIYVQDPRCSASTP